MIVKWFRSPSSFTTTPPPESTVDPFAIAVRPRIDTISDVQPYNDTNITWTSGSSDSSDSMSYSLFFGSCVMLAILIYFVRWIRKWRHRRIRYSIPRPIRLASLDTLENGTVSSTCETPTHRQAMEYTAMDSWRHRRTRYSIPRTIDFNSLDTLEHGTANELEHETGFDLDLDETLPSNCETTTPSLPPRRQPIRLEYVEPESIRETDTYPYGYVDLTASTSFVPLQSRSLLMKDIRERDGRI